MINGIQIDNVVGQVANLRYSGQMAAGWQPAPRHFLPDNQ
jgi:hypothetical protein